MKWIVSAMPLLLLAGGTSVLSGCSDENIQTIPKQQQPLSATQAETEKLPSPLPANKPANKPVQQTEPEGSDAIRELQRRLSAKGYYIGPIDGIMTPELRKAAKGDLRDRL
jgi:hypothetical protein